MRGVPAEATCEEQRAAIPMGRFGQAIEVVEAIAFLAFHGHQPPCRRRLVDDDHTVTISGCLTAAAIRPFGAMRLTRSGLLPAAS